MSELTPNTQNNSVSQPKSLTVTARRTLNLGDYNSVTYEASVEVDTNGEPIKDVYDKAWVLVTNQVKKRILEHNEV